MPLLRLWHQTLEMDRQRGRALPPSASMSRSNRSRSTAGLLDPVLGGDHNEVIADAVAAAVASSTGEGSAAWTSVAAFGIDEPIKQIPRARPVCWIRCLAGDHNVSNRCWHLLRNPAHIHISDPSNVCSRFFQIVHTQVNMKTCMKDLKYD